MTEWLLVLWVLKGAESGGWGYKEAWMPSLEICQEMGDRTLVERANIYDYTCIPRPAEPDAA